MNVLLEVIEEEAMCIICNQMSPAADYVTKDFIYWDERKKKYMCLDQKNRTTSCSANIRAQMAGSHKLLPLSLHVAHKLNQIRIMKHKDYVENCN